jgi:hypothetical protein
MTSSGLPCLVEAATRREDAIVESLAARAKVQAVHEGKVVSRLVAREKTRGSTRIGLVAPFGMPLPPVVEYKSEVSSQACQVVLPFPGCCPSVEADKQFTLSDEEDFWGIIAQREASAGERRRAALAASMLTSDTNERPPTDSTSEHDMKEEEGNRDKSTIGGVVPVEEKHGMEQDVVEGPSEADVEAQLEAELEDRLEMDGVEEVVVL